MNDEDWSMIIIVVVVLAFVIGALDYETSVLLVLMNIAALIADQA